MDSVRGASAVGSFYLPCIDHHRGDRSGRRVRCCLCGCRKPVGYRPAPSAVQAGWNLWEAGYDCMRARKTERSGSGDTMRPRCLRAWWMQHELREWMTILQSLCEDQVSRNRGDTQSVASDEQMAGPWQESLHGSRCAGQWLCWTVAVWDSGCAGQWLCGTVAVRDGKQQKTTRIRADA